MIGIGKTRIVWNDVYEELMCEKCKGILYYSLGFNVCPYCSRKIIKTDARRTKTSVGRCRGVIAR